MHRTLMRAFPDEYQGSSREACGMLYRVMRERTGVRLFVLSEHCPDWRAISDQGFVIRGVKDVSNLPASFTRGRRFAFDALLCPTKKVSRQGRNGRRAFLSSADDRLQWLERKATQAGFLIEWVREEGQSKERGVHQPDRGGTMYHAGVRYRGVLVVEDSKAFCKAFARGIGPGKAYGFGMLMLFKATSA
jgi:CRISPR system Cascade subunit CasE